MNVWRIHLKNSVKAPRTRQMLLQFCKDNKLIGVGWPAMKCRNTSRDAIRQDAAKSYPNNPTPGFKAINAMSQMKVDDLIWTRLNGVYYLCRVTDLWVNSKPTDEHDAYDISNYISAEWCEIGLEHNVPGRIVNSFTPSSSAQQIRYVEVISRYIWNKYTGTNHYEIVKPKISIWSLLSAEQTEEIVLLYLQKVKGYHIYSTTMKFTTREYECIMVNDKGQHAYPQVKSGNVHLNANDYMDALKYDKDGMVYLFTSAESYTPNGCTQVQFLYRKELETFMKENYVMLPELIKSWVDMSDIG